MATNFFITFTGPAITGEAGDSTHQGQIQVLSWSHGFNQPTSPTRSSAGAGTVEQANHQTFTFTKYIDSATDDLLKYCWTGKHIATAKFTAYRSDGSGNGVNYLTIDFEQVIVANYAVSGAEGDVAIETIALNYGKVTYTYIPQKTADGTGDGAQPISHDLVAQVVA